MLPIPQQIVQPEERRLHHRAERLILGKRIHLRSHPQANRANRVRGAVCETL